VGSGGDDRLAALAAVLPLLFARDARRLGHQDGCCQFPGIPVGDGDQAVGWRGFPVWRAMLAGVPRCLAVAECEADAGQDESEAVERESG